MIEIIDTATFLTVPLAYLQFRVDTNVARRTGFEALCPRQVSHAHQPNDLPNQQVGS